MAVPEFHNGADGKAYVKPAGGASFIEAGVTKWDLTITSNNQDVSNTLSGRKRIAGVPDASGTATLHYDTANNPADDTASTGLNLRHGSIFTGDFVQEGEASGGTGGFRGSFIVDSVKPTSEFEGTIDYEVAFSLEDGSTLKYPGDA